MTFDNCPAFFFLHRRRLCTASHTAAISKPQKQRHFKAETGEIIVKVHTGSYTLRRSRVNVDYVPRLVFLHFPSTLHYKFFRVVVDNPVECGQPDPDRRLESCADSTSYSAPDALRFSQRVTLLVSPIQN